MTSVRRMMGNADLCFAAPFDLKRLILSRQMSPLEPHQDHPWAEWNASPPVINAFLTISPDVALEQAKSAKARVMRNSPLGPL